jgi:phosphoglycerate dehydrogenase-like enzyme
MENSSVNVLLTIATEPHLFDQVRNVSPRLNVTQLMFPALAQDMDVMLPYLMTTDVLLGFRMDFDLAAAPRLKWIQYTGAGIDYWRDSPIMGSDVTITNVHLFGTPIAEYVMLSILSFRHRFPQVLVDFRANREFPADPWLTHRSEILAGTTLGVIGYGQIGRAVARLGKAFQMRVLATRASANEHDQEDGLEIFPATQLHRVLAESDQVVVTLPLTHTTEKLIGEPELRAMKPNAYLVNVGRGKVIDEPVLVRALQEGWIAGAGLDVFASRPLEKDSPLFELPHVLLTPHISGTSVGYEEGLINLFCENLERFLDGKPLLNVIDKERGY